MFAFSATKNTDGNRQSSLAIDSAVSRVKERGWYFGMMLVENFSDSFTEGKQSEPGEKSVSNVHGGSLL